MVVHHEHYSHCEEVKLLDLTNDEYVIEEDDDAELLLRFVINQRDFHEKDGEILNEVSEEIIHGFKIDMEELLNNEILQELFQQDYLLITTDFKHLVDFDILQDFVRDMLIEIGNNTLKDTNHLFLHNSVERLHKDISVQIYNLFKSTGGATIVIHLEVVNMHCYENIQEYHVSQMEALLRTMVLLDNQLSEYEEEVIQLVQSASMEMVQPADDQPKGASRASIDGLERIKYKSEDCKQVTSCSVCCEEFMIEEEIRKMPCSSAHIFHADCIQKWLEINHICPVCRYQMPTE
ncbi:hypothetical protein FRX31_013490 [Thalictrum thalictroides]|uniref:RING-type domain-containing protein n=1 Tax=Thalictrum thalictroides TaxID=46969 RepID=A0A7J6WLD2_THATH|nr:hypothetical protein FRX31_013490 [Thalictrum thalictroides]